MTAASDRVASGANRRTLFTDAEVSRSVVRPGVLVRVLVLLVVALVIFAHGCHTGDHDDEPSFAPPVHDLEPPR